MRLPFLLLALAILFFPFSAPQARGISIAVVVNHDAITLSEVDDRMKLIMTSSGLPQTQEIKVKLLPQVINSLIEEQLKLQEAETLKINIPPEDIQNGFAEIARQNNFTPAQFRSVLGQNGVNVETMNRQIRSQIAWSRVIQKSLLPKISVSDSDVDAYLERLRAAAGKREYLLAEIFLPVEDPKDDNDTRQLAHRLYSEINSGQAPFYKIAQQFSKAAGSAQGGDIGWVQQGQLPDELDKALPMLEKGRISTPLRSLSGYHILLVRDFRTISEDTLPSSDQVINILGGERMDRAQRRHLLDLKATAFIENRLGP